MGIGLRYRPDPVPVRFERRLHRFAARVRTASGGRLLAHVPNPGRMRELLVPGVLGWMVPSERSDRTTAGTLVAVRHRGTLVSLDTLLPNRLVARTLDGPKGASFLGVPSGRWRAEVGWGSSRFDFALLPEGRGRPRALLEVKSANLRVGAGALFPDAPTVRGTRHLDELARAAGEGISAHVLFVVQRADVGSVGPHRRLDPEFARACDAAARAGVRFGARRLLPSARGARWGAAVPWRGLPA